jgi:hypothetical protein
MNDTERDLRELFESKARDAGGAPPVTREVLRRGRRRQVGTVAVAAVTALAVAAVAVVSLQALHRADTSVPGGSTGNPAFNATIQNFTIAVPKGWTLIDQWPLGSLMAVDQTSTKFACVGAPIEAGSGKNDSPASSSSDCAAQQTQTPEPPMIPEGGLPMLSLSNDDPGLGRSVCNAGGSLPASSATLYIGLDYAVTQSADWQSKVPAWPDPLGNVLRNDLPPDQMPCGPGGYAHFQTGGMPYTAWAGFGSDVTDSDRQAIIDSFNGMRVSDGDITPPSADQPGYVLAGGTTESGSAWTIEVSPSSRNVDMHYSEVGTSAGGAADFTVPDVPIEASTGHPVVFGAVTFDADRVEVRPSDGSDPIPGTILHIPDSLGAPFDAFVAPNSPGGEVVAIGPEGDLGSTATTPVGPEPAPTVDDVQSDLRNAYVAAKTYYADSHSYEGFGPREAASIEPSLAYNTNASAVTGEVSIRDVGADHILLVEATASASVFCIAEDIAGTTTYGAVDAQRTLDCSGGEASWGKAVPTPTPKAQPTESSVALQGFGSQSPATLTVRRDAADECLSIEIAIGDGEGAGTCGGAGIQPIYVYMTTVGGANAVFGYVPPTADQVYLTASDAGRRFDAAILYTLDVEPRVQFFAFRVPVTTGLLHVTDVNGAELRSPIPLNSAP